PADEPPAGREGRPQGRGVRWRARGDHRSRDLPEGADAAEVQRQGWGAEARNKYGALLRGLLRCKGCDCAMTHTFSSARGGKRYRYYRCVRAIKSGADACASGSLPALNIERLV